MSDSLCHRGPAKSRLYLHIHNRMPLQLLPICVDYWHEQKVLSSFSRQRKNDVFGLVGCQIVLALQLVVY
jgi:hypothetical protein